MRRLSSIVAFAPAHALTAVRTKYSDAVLDHYDNPRNVGSMDKSDPDVGTGIRGAAACGDFMQVQLKVNPDTLVIEDTKFKAFGCASAIASSSFASEVLRGKSLADAMKLTNKDIAAELKWLRTFSRSRLPRETPKVRREDSQPLRL